MKVNQNCETDAITLAEEAISFGGMMLEYRLLVCNTYADRFRVQVASGSERSETCVGNHIGSALELYRALVHGRVTPCVLDDVMYDLCRQG